MFTYFVQDGRPDFVKIGRSHNPVARMTEADTWSPIPFKFLAVLPGDRETELHDRFAKDHVRGEWYRFTPEIQAWLDKAKGESVSMTHRHPNLLAVESWFASVKAASLRKKAELCAEPEEAKAMLAGLDERTMTSWEYWFKTNAPARPGELVLKMYQTYELLYDRNDDLLDAIEAALAPLVPVMVASFRRAADRYDAEAERGWDTVPGATCADCEARWAEEKKYFLERERERLDG